MAVTLIGSGCSDTVTSDEEFLKTVRERQETALPENEAALAPPITAGNEALPKIAVETQHLDLGTIPNNDFGRGTVRISNTGKGPLVIRDIQTSCACTMGFLDESEKTVQAGGEAIMDVMVDPNRIHGFHSTKTLSVISNDPNQGLVEIKVSARVDPEFEIVPENYNFGEVRREEVNEFTAIVRQIQDLPLEVEKVAPFDPANPEVIPDDLIVTSTRRPEDQWSKPGKAEYEVHVKLAPDAPVGAFVHQFNIFTNIPRVRVYRFTTEGTLRAFYAVEPDPGRPFIVKDIEAQTDQAPSVLKISADRAFVLENVNYDAGILNVTVELGADGQSAEMTVTLQPGLAPGRVTTDLDFEIVAGSLREKQHISVAALKGQPQAAAQ